MTEITETIPGLGTVPQTTDPENFDARGDSLLANELPALITSLNTFRTQANALAVTVNDNKVSAAASAAIAVASEAAALGAANYKGDWSALTGALNVPSSVSHSNDIWMLINNLADVTASEPSSSNSDWQSLLPAAFSIGDIIETGRALTSPEWLPANGGTYLQSAYPDLYAAIGNIYLMGRRILDTPSTIPSSTVNGGAISPDGTYQVLACQTSPFAFIYKKAGATLTKVADPSTIPTGNGQGACFDSTGTYMAFSHTNSPFLSIYKRAGDVFTKLSNPASLPPGTGRKCAFDPSDTYLAHTSEVSPYLSIYKRDGDTFDKLANPATMPTGVGQGVSWDSTGTYLMVSHNTSPYISIYKRDGDTFTKLSNPSVLPNNNAVSCAFHPSEPYVVVGSAVEPYTMMYERTGDTFDNIPLGARAVSSYAYSMGFSGDGKIFIATSSTNREAVTYLFESGALTEIDGPAWTANTPSQQVSISADGGAVVFSLNTSPYIASFDNFDFDTATEFKTPKAAYTAGVETFIKAT